MQRLALAVENKHRAEILIKFFQPVQLFRRSETKRFFVIDSQNARWNTPEKCYSRRDANFTDGRDDGIASLDRSLPNSRGRNRDSFPNAGTPTSSRRSSLFCHARRVPADGDPSSGFDTFRISCGRSQPKIPTRESPRGRSGSCTSQSATCYVRATQRSVPGMARVTARV